MIRGDDHKDLIRPRTGGGIVLNRTAFQRALICYIDDYGRQLGSDTDLKFAFVRKMDDVCHIRRVDYFAYGSNMRRATLADRKITLLHESVVGCLENFRFRYNKTSTDGTSKANIVPEVGEKVWGVCYEIDDGDFRKISKVEKKYDPLDVPIRTTTHGLVIAKTFVSKDLTATKPSPAYLTRVVAGAREHGLPEHDVKDVLEQA